MRIVTTTPPDLARGVVQVAGAEAEAVPAESGRRRRGAYPRVAEAMDLAPGAPLAALPLLLLRLLLLALPGVLGVPLPGVLWPGQRAGAGAGGHWGYCRPRRMP